LAKRIVIVKAVRAGVVSEVEHYLNSRVRAYLSINGILVIEILAKSGSLERYFFSV